MPEKKIAGKHEDVLLKILS